VYLRFTSHIEARQITPIELLNTRMNSARYVRILRAILLFLTKEDIRIISLCQELLNFELPSVQLERRCKKICE